MLAKKIVAKHVVHTTFIAMLGAVLLLSGMQILFSYLSELSDLNEHYTAWKAFQYVLWNAPEYTYQIIPISALMGAVVGLGTLASNSELVAMRAAGISLWSIVAWVMRPAVLLIFLSFALNEWVMPYSNERAKSVQNQQFAASLGEVRGYWTRENDHYIYIDYANSQGQLKNIQRLTIDEQRYLNEWLSAQDGQFIKPNEWQLHNVTQTQIQPTTRVAKQNQHDEQALTLALQPEYVHLVTRDAEDLSPSQLLNLMRYMDTYSQIPKTYQLAFWQKLMSPFALMALVLIACSFVFGPLRQRTMSFRVVIALFTGLGFYYLQDFLGYASLVYQPSVIWFVCLPILVMFGIGGYLLHKSK